MKKQIVLPGMAHMPEDASPQTAPGPKSLSPENEPGGADSQTCLGPDDAASDMQAGPDRTAESEDWPPLAQMLHSLFVFEPTTPAPVPITVLGLDCGRPRGLAALTSEQRTLVRTADVICGGKALLAEFSGGEPGGDNGSDDQRRSTAGNDTPLKARLLPLSAPLEPLLSRLSQMRAAGDRVLLLADGDPLLFGIGATLVRQLGAEAVRLLPAVSSLQQACARLALPWHKVICLSLHGRDDLGPLNVAVGKGAPLCVLTDARMTPDVLARHLLDRGVDWFAAHVFERMGAPNEEHHKLSLAEAAGRSFGQACTLLLIPRDAPRRPCLGLDTGQLAVERGSVSKQSVRAAVLSLLRIGPRHVVWDIGAGCGAMALEAAVLAHEGRVVAVERSAGRAMSIQENRRRFGTAILDVRLGQAPECLPSLPDPQRVCIEGGLSGEEGEDILEHVCHRLPPGGRVAASCVLLDTLNLCRRFFETLGWPLEIMQIQTAEARELDGDLHLAALNPIFVLAAQKPGVKPRGKANGQ